MCCTVSEVMSDLLKPRDDLVGVLLRDDALAGQHTRMCLTAKDVVWIKPAVIGDGLRKLQDQLVGSGRKAAAPKGLLLCGHGGYSSRGGLPRWRMQSMRCVAAMVTWLSSKPAVVSSR